MNAQLSGAERSFAELVELRNTSLTPEQAAGLGHLSHDREGVRLDIQNRMEQVGAEIKTLRLTQQSLEDWAATADRAYINGL